MKEKNRNILVVVTGGISAYKSIDVMSALKKQHQGFHVSAMATESALQFVSENVLEITADKYWKHSWSEPIHINATENIDIFAVIPATANIIAKFVYGIADDLVSSTHLALPSNTIKIICPAMNTRMISNVIVQDNLVTLRSRGWKVLNPVSGMLACGTEGIGKLPPTRDIVSFIVNMPLEENK